MSFPVGKKVPYRSALSPDSKYMVARYIFLLQKEILDSLTLDLEVKNITSGRTKPQFDGSLSPDSKYICLQRTFLLPV
jgi:hypothetical protein